MASPDKHDTPPAVITGASRGRSVEASKRQRNYLIMMAIRVLCFVGLLWAPGNTKWVLLAGAVVLPYIAVLVVNQTDQRTRPVPSETDAEPVDAGAPERAAVAAAPEVIEGEVVDDERAVRAALDRGPEHHRARR